MKNQYIQNLHSNKCYQNSGNPFVLDFLDLSDREILDVGCGAGGNAKLILGKYPESHVYGISLSEAERSLAAQTMQACWIADVETSDLGFISDRRFDRILFCHVLEHFRDPALILKKFVPFLRPSGKILVVVPNTAFWKQRLRFLLGDIVYEDEGIMDRAHVRLFTFHNLEDVLSLRSLPQLVLVRKKAEGFIALGILRQVFHHDVVHGLDRWGVENWPNLFGYQIAVEFHLAERIVL